MTGSKALEEAIDYVHAEMEKDGLNTYTEEVVVPIWKRGFESAQLVTPRKMNIQILGLGSSVGTIRGGIISSVIVVESFDELNSLNDTDVQGKIVVYAQKYVSYPKTVPYRSAGASVASRKGAVAALINSITPFSLSTPHTGHQSYLEGVKKIPAACITAEDADMLLRMYRRGIPLEIHLEMEDGNLPDGKSRNLMGELVGSVKKNTSVVVVSGHVDSWDVGTGAMDDGGGAFIAWHATTFLKQMGLQPKRTIRSILWTAEEQGYVGAEYYRQSHKLNEKEEFNFFIESDMGTFEPLGLDFSGNDDAYCIHKQIVQLLAPLNATSFTTPQDSGPDISVWTEDGFPGASLMNKNEKYFYYHHSNADSMLVEKSENLDKCTAVFAVAAYVVADLSFDIPKNVK